MLDDIIHIVDKFVDLLLDIFLLARPSDDDGGDIVLFYDVCNMKKNHLVIEQISHGKNNLLIYNLVGKPYIFASSIDS